MTEPITGSLEIRSSVGESSGVPGKRWTLEAVPVVLETIHGITDVQTAEPTEQPTGRTPEAQWTGTDAQNQPVDIFLWEDIPFDATAVGQALARAILEGQGGT